MGGGGRTYPVVLVEKMAFLLLVMMVFLLVMMVFLLVMIVPLLPGITMFQLA